MDGVACGFGQRFNVNAPARQLCGETCILSVTPNRKAELILIDNHRRSTIAFHFRKIDATYPSGADGFGNINHGILIPLNNVNFLVVEFLDNRLNTDTFDPYTRADRINTSLGRHNGDFGTGTRLTCNRTDLNHTVINFRNLVLEQTSQKVAMRTGKNNLRAA